VLALVERTQQPDTWLHCDDVAFDYDLGHSCVAW
jgi:hypothetical protein